jgi:hypothetical protein
MKATKHTLALVGFLLAAGFCSAQTLQTDTVVPTPTVADTAAVIIKAPMYDTGKVNTYCPTCDNTGAAVNNNHVTPYYKKNGNYPDPTRMANTKAKVVSQDGGRPSINGARSSGTAYYYNGIRLLDNSPVSRIPGQ